MLKKYTHPLLEQIRAQGLDPFRFTSAHERVEDYDTFIILVRDHAQLYFRLRAVPVRSGREFRWECTNYRRGHPAPTYPPETRVISCSFDMAQREFGSWLRDEAGQLLGDLDEEAEDLLQPDLWAEVEGASRSAGLLNAELENTAFSLDEQTRIEASFDDFERRVQEKLDLTADQMKVIQQHVTYLVEASKRLGRKDWTGVAVATLFAIASQVALSPEAARQILNLGNEALRWIVSSPFLLH